MAGSEPPAEEETADLETIEAEVKQLADAGSADTGSEEIKAKDTGVEDGGSEQELKIVLERGDTGSPEGATSSPEMEELPMEDWDYQRPRRGQVRPGVILAIRDQEIIIDVGAKRDGIVPYADMQRLGPEAVEALSVGQEIPVHILRPEDKEGNLLVSLFLARQAAAWEKAQGLFENGTAWEVEITGYNKGGVVVPLDEIRGFVPASQIPGFPMGLSQEDRLTRLSEYVGDKIQVKVIEINRRKRRLILSATAAQKQWRRRQREQLLEELREGEVRTGTVSSLCSFGAFVDLGGADGLVHISELSWRRVRHPREVVSVGEEVEVYVLRLDHERNRIGLSIKRLEPEPWALVEDKYELGQLVEGVVTNVVDFGAFAEIEAGVEGLIHVSELADAQINHPKEVVKKGDLLLLRIIRIDARRKRLGLSLKRVLESEWAEWAARLAKEEKAQEKESAAKKEPAEPEAEEPVEAEAETTAEAEAEVGVPAEVEAPVKAEAEVEAPAEVEAEVEAPAEAEVEAPAEVETPAEAEAEVEAPAEVETPTEPEAEVEAPAEVEAKVETPSEAEIEVPVEADAETPAEAEVETPIETEVEAPAEAEADEPTEPQSPTSEQDEEAQEAPDSPEITTDDVAAQEEPELAIVEA
jgi:small subunit ribosomal protein S1